MGKCASRIFPHLLLPLRGEGAQTRPRKGENTQNQTHSKGSYNTSNDFDFRCLMVETSPAPARVPLALADYLYSGGNA